MNASIRWGGLTPTTETSLFLTAYRSGSHLLADIIENAILTMIQKTATQSYKLQSFHLYILNLLFSLRRHSGRCMSDVFLPSHHFPDIRHMLLSCQSSFRPEQFP